MPHSPCSSDWLSARAPDSLGLRGACRPASTATASPRKSLQRLLEQATLPQWFADPASPATRTNALGPSSTTDICRQVQRHNLATSTPAAGLATRLGKGGLGRRLKGVLKIRTKNKGAAGGDALVFHSMW